MVASTGSIISVVAVVFLIICLVERLGSKRPILFRIYLSGSLEAVHAFPPIEHRYERSPKLYVV